LRIVIRALAALVCLLLIGQMDARAAAPDEFTDASPAFAEALTGVRRSHVVLDREGNVVAVGVPGSGPQRAGKDDQSTMMACGISEEKPKWDRGQGGAFHQDGVLSRATNNWYYFTWAMPSGKGKMNVALTVQVTGPSGPRSTTASYKLKRGHYYLWWTRFALLTAPGVHTMTASVDPGDSCETSVFAF